MPEAIAVTLTVGAILLAMYVLIALGVRLARWVANRWVQPRKEESLDEAYDRWRRGG